MKYFFTFTPWSMLATCLSMVGLLSGCPSAVSEKGDENPVTTALPSLPKAGTEAGIYTIDSSGGSGGTTAQGGQAGAIAVVLSNGGNGRLEVLKHGKANAAFTLATKSPELGLKPVIVSASTEILALDPTGQKPSLGTPYMVRGDFHLYIASSSSKFPDPAEVATGLQIDSGATLKLNLNHLDWMVAYLIFSNDVVNRGAIVTADSGSSFPTRVGLRLWVNNYIGSGSITTKGTAADTRTNGQGVAIQADGYILNSGLIDSSGYNATASDAAFGGQGGDISFNAFASVENTGSLVSAGGDTEAIDGSGGKAGKVKLYSVLGHLYNSGSIDASGGNGTQSGGSGNNIELISEAAGDLQNTGSITSSGGDGKGTTSGSAGNIRLRARGGNLINSGNLTANGGKAVNPYSGGRGGNIDIATAWGDIESPPGNLILSGNISSRGGTSVGTGEGDGGRGGNISIEGNAALTIEQDGEPRTIVNARIQQLVGLWGYTTITAAGGTGNLGGGGGEVNLSSVSGIDMHGGNWDWVTSGNVMNEVDIFAVGGNSSFKGGKGGNITLSVVPAGLSDPSVVLNSGALTTSAGTNEAYIASLNPKLDPVSGSVRFSASGGISNHGKIDASGSEDGGLVEGRGNKAGEVWMLCGAGTVTNTAAILANGGNGQQFGGDGTGVALAGVKLFNSGNIFTTGGNALSTTLLNTYGGYGGSIILGAKAIDGLSNSGTLNHKGGTGKTAGYDGHVALLSGI